MQKLIKHKLMSKSRTALMILMTMWMFQWKFWQKESKNLKYSNFLRLKMKEMSFWLWSLGLEQLKSHHINTQNKQNNLQRQVWNYNIFMDIERRIAVNIYTILHQKFLFIMQRQCLFSTTLKTTPKIYSLIIMTIFCR